jgi:hypothetical protein
MAIAVRSALSMAAGVAFGACVRSPMYQGELPLPAGALRVPMEAPPAAPCMLQTRCSYEFSEINLKGIWTCSDRKGETYDVKVF